MTRGRRKDLSIPTSRALTQQRDYRARKAKNLADLEERCRRAELENEKLRKELELARGGLPVRPATVSSETAQATTELMQHLSAALASLTRFQQLAISDNQPLPSPAPIQSCPSSFPSPATSSPFPSSIISFYPTSYNEINSQTETFPKPTDTPSNTNTTSHLRQTLRASPGSDEECCGGLIDCRSLVENEAGEDIEAISSNSLVKNSNIRSTLDGGPNSVGGFRNPSMI